MLVLKENSKICKNKKYLKPKKIKIFYPYKTNFSFNQNLEFTFKLKLFKNYLIYWLQ